MLIDGKAILSCTTLTVEYDGKAIQTIEGLRDPVAGDLDPLQQAFVDHSAFQCRYCTPGILIIRLSLFGKFKALKDSFISNQDLIKKYHWDEGFGAFIWGNSGGLIRVNEKGNKVLMGLWCMGNLQFSGAVTLKPGGVEPAKDTVMIYPIRKKPNTISK